MHVARISRIININDQSFSLVNLIPELLYSSITLHYMAVIIRHGRLIIINNS